MTDVLSMMPSRCRLEPATTSVEFATRHLFGLAPVRGRMTLRTGTAEVRTPESASRVLAEIDSASFTTDNPRRDHTVRGRRYLDADAYPTLTFAGDRIDGDVLSGTLTVRGVTRPVQLQLTRIDPDRDGFLIDAVTRIDRYAFGITASRGMAARHLQVTVRTRVIPE